MSKPQFIDVPIEGSKVRAVVCTACRRMFAVAADSNLKMVKASHKCSGSPKPKKRKAAGGSTS